MDKELLLHNYFSNQLTEQEEKLFNELLDSDSEFKTQFEFENDLKRVIKDGQNRALKTKLVDFEKDIEKEAPVTKSSGGFRKWSIAASIALLMGLGWFTYNSMSGTNYQDLYNDNFEAYPNTVYIITRSGGDASLEREAFVAYEASDYQQAADLFIENKESIAHSDFYLGQSYLNLGENEEAIELFAKAILEDTEFEAEANWYLALAYLKKEDKANAIATLERHVKNFEFNKTKAIELLKVID